jgi:hypothetical protein
MTEELAKHLIDLAGENSWPCLSGDLELMKKKKGPYYTGAELAEMGHAFKGMDLAMMYELQRQSASPQEALLPLVQSLAFKDRYDSYREVPSEEVVAVLAQVYSVLFPPAEDDDLLPLDDYTGPHPRPYVTAKQEFQPSLEDLVIK